MIYKDQFIFTDENIAHRERVRNVYRTEDGRKELMNLIVDSGVFSDIPSERLPLRNYAIKKLEEMGMLDEVIVRKLIDHFFEIDPRQIEMSEMERQKREKLDGRE